VGRATSKQGGAADHDDCKKCGCDHESGAVPHCSDGRRRTNSVGRVRAAAPDDCMSPDSDDHEAGAVPHCGEDMRRTNSAGRVRVADRSDLESMGDGSEEDSGADDQESGHPISQRDGRVAGQCITRSVGLATPPRGAADHDDRDAAVRDRQGEGAREVKQKKG